MRLNLGCCDRHYPGHVNVDIAPPADVIADLSERWPFEDGSVQSIEAQDVLEHLPDKIHTMNEAHRVLEIGGRIHLSVPTTDGRGAFQDPTHRSFWTPNDLWYYEDGNIHRERFAKHYGITARFKILGQDHFLLADEVWMLRATMEAVR